MKKYICQGIALSMLLSSVPSVLYAKEDVQETGSETMTSEDGIQVEVSDVSDLHEGKPEFYFADPSSDTAQSDVKAMYRLYNHNSGEHFYTSNPAEKTMLADKGWTIEGVGWFAPAASEQPVYRLYNANAGDHHYTMNKEERDELIRVGWKDEGIGWYSADGSGQPLYRSYNPNAQAGAHNYTVDANEYNTLTARGWTPEGIGWYGAKVTAPSEDLVNELTANLTDYQNRMDQASQTVNQGYLYTYGLRISSILKSLEDKFPEKRYVFQDGKLIGHSTPGTDVIFSKEIDPKKPVVVITPWKRQIMMADTVTNRFLDGKACFLSARNTPSLYTSSYGTLKDGEFDGKTTRFERYYTGSLWQNELAVGNSINNIMNGRIEMHTKNVRDENNTLNDYRWYMTTVNGTAQAVNKNGYYYVYEAPGTTVYYDFLPENLRFWYE